MAMSEEDIGDLQKLIKKAKQKPLPYGLCLGKKPEDNVMYMDLKKPSATLMRKAKADGDTTKLTNGTASVKGKVMSLSIEGKMIPGLAKNMKTFMTKQGMMMKIVITDPNGTELEAAGDEDGEDNDGNDDVNIDDGNDDIAVMDASEQNEDTGNDTDGVQDEDTNTSESNTDDPMMGKWAQVNSALTPHVERFVASGHKKSAAIAGAWQGAQAAADKSDYKTAMAVANKIKPVVTAVQEQAQQPTQQENVDPNKAAWEKTMGPTSALYTKAMANNPENRSQLEAAWGMATEKAELGDYASALKIVERLTPRLEAAAQATQTGQDKVIPEDVVEFQKSRVLWVGVKAKMHSEIDQLISVIEKECAGDEDLAEVAAAAPQLKTYLDPFDAKLEDILDNITTSEQGAERTRLKSDAVAAISDYQNALKDPFFSDVDKNNGFKPITVAAPAIASLEKIRKVCAA